MKNQLTLGQLIFLLERVEDHTAEVRFDFGYFKPDGIDSYRGFYEQLAIGYSDEREDVTVAELIELLKDAVEKEFTGYKGGEYTMTEGTPMWAANYGKSNSTAIVGVIDEGYVVILETAYRSW